MKQLFPLLFVLSFGVLSCSKNDGENQQLDPDAQTKFDFMSTKEGSYWQYGGRDGVTFTRYARNKDTVKFGLKYSYYQRRDDNAQSFQPEYFGRNGDAYITLIDLDGEETSYINYIYWKDGAGKGASWENTGKIASPIGEIVTRVSSNVAENQLTMTIGSKTYTGVVHVHSDLKATAANVGVGTVDIWFAKNTGIIREEADINILGQYTMKHTDSLINYFIAP